MNLPLPASESAGPWKRFVSDRCPLVCRDGSATGEERATFTKAWHGRVRSVLTDDGLFAVERIEARS